MNTDYRIQMDHALLLGKILLQGIRIVVATPKRRCVHTAEDVPDSAESPQEALEKALDMVSKTETHRCCSSPRHSGRYPFSTIVSQK